MSDAAGPTGYRVTLPIGGEAYDRPPADLIGAFETISAATAAAVLHRMGIRRTFMVGPRPLRSGQRVVGAALTLQFMPKREDVSFSNQAQEHAEKRTALWAVIDSAQAGDVLVVQAYGDRQTGVAGEMLTQVLANHGALGIVVDGCIRDTPHILGSEISVWSVGSTPNYASQADLFPWAYSVPVAVGGVLVLPGDIIIADDDGAVCVPLARARELCELANEHEAKEVFSRMRLSQGGDLRHFYPLDELGWEEFVRWRAESGGDTGVSS